MIGPNNCFSHLSSQQVTAAMCIYIIISGVSTGKNISGFVLKIKKGLRDLFLTCNHVFLQSKSLITRHNLESVFCSGSWPLGLWWTQTSSPCSARGLVLLYRVPWALLKCLYTSQPFWGKQGDAKALGGIQGQLGRGEDLAPCLEDVVPGTAAHAQHPCLQFGHF